MKAKNLSLWSALFASICCLGPLLLILLGLGSLGIGTLIGKYHWWLVGAGVLLIFLAWIYFFKEKKNCDLKGCEIENKTSTPIFLITATLIVAFFAGLSLYTYAGSPSKGTLTPTSANLKNVVIPVEGITCITCEFSVSSSLKKINGVADVKASAKEGNVKINYDPNKTEVEKLIETINKTGYKARIPK